MNGKYWVKACAIIGVALGMSLSANANTISYYDSIGLLQTNWSKSVTIPKFNPALIPDFDPVYGSLDSITFTLTGQVMGNTGFENRDSAPADIILDISAFIRLQRPNVSDIWFSFPTATAGDSVDAFDGTIDFNGGSGRTYTGLSQSMVSSITTMLPSDLSLFTGSGNIILPVIAKGFSSGSGAGNLVLFFETQAAADLEVTYGYTIPEPATLMLLGLGSLALLRRRKFLIN